MFALSTNHSTGQWNSWNHEADEPLMDTVEFGDSASSLGVDVASGSRRYLGNLRNRRDIAMSRAHEQRHSPSGFGF
jgi:hypothetical protein